VYQLAQLNVAVMKSALDSPPMADFAGNLERINRLAEHSPGYLWRLESDAGDATAFRPMGEHVLVNLSVWQDIESLSNYVYRSQHVEIMRRRREWFDRMSAAYLVLWWVPAGHRPTVEEAVERLEALRANGPSPSAFTFGHAYGPPDPAEADDAFGLGDACPA
jgi:Domain of unknown function (DUF3291)